MENATEAMKMGASVLIFVLALSLFINAFADVKAVSETLINYNDREYETQYIQDNDIVNKTVGIETIIPTISRIFNENIRIVFEDMPLFKVYNNSNEVKDINYIDLKELNLSKKEEHDFILAIIYGEKNILAIPGYNFDEIQKSFKLNKKIELKNKGLYDTILNKEFKEQIGMFYVEELPHGNEDIQKNEIPDVNKTLKRVITYTEIK